MISIGGGNDDVITNVNNMILPNETITEESCN